MKFNIEIDCTPAELRHSLGLPNLEPMQEAVMKRIEERMLSNMDKFSPEKLMQTWFSPQNAEQMQKIFMSLLTQGFGGGGRAKQ
jgi:Family of unknown function (DUF6489)